MKEIIDWLITVELLANNFYSQAAKLFPDDNELTLFLNKISEDEAYHYHIMGSAADYLVRSKTQKTASIRVDDYTKEKVEGPFKKNLQLIANKKLTKDLLIDSIIDSEFSELNEIFLYIINLLKEEERVFENSAAKIQNHLNHITYYLNTTVYGNKKLAALKKIPCVWKPKILLVDDEAAILSLLTAVLGGEWKTDVAPNGSEALEKIKKSHYDLIISDIDMPVMDGMELFEQASAVIKNLKDLFIFHSGGVSSARKEYFRHNKMMFLEKPSSIHEITELVKRSLQKFPIAEKR